jgi:transcriptional regulator with XRE-family HTH domain
MSCEINERITLLRKELKLSQTAFGERLGVSRSVIQNIDDKNTEPKPLFIQHICKVYNVDPDWLETGKGEMFLRRDAVTELLDFAADLFTNKSLGWVRCLCEYIAQLTPEEQEAASRHITALAESIAAQKKEQD